MCVRVLLSSEHTACNEVTNRLTLSCSFDRLFSYISGANDQKKAIEMTSPVPVRVNRVGGVPFSNNTFEIGFMVPFEFQPNPPKPVSMDRAAVAVQHVDCVCCRRHRMCTLPQSLSTWPLSLHLEGLLIKASTVMRLWSWPRCWMHKGYPTNKM